MLREVLDLRIFRVVVLLVGIDLGLKRLLLVVAFSRRFLRIDSFLVGSSEGFLRGFTGGGALLLLVLELRLEGGVGLVTLGDLLPDLLPELLEHLESLDEVGWASQVVVEALKRGINRGFVGAIFYLGEHIFVAGGHLAVGGGVDIFQLSERRLDLLRKLLVDWAECSSLGGEGDGVGNVCHAGCCEERSHRRILIIIRFGRRPQFILLFLIKDFSIKVRKPKTIPNLQL